VTVIYNNARVLFGVRRRCVTTDITKFRSTHNGYSLLKQPVSIIMHLMYPSSGNARRSDATDKALANCEHSRIGAAALLKQGHSRLKWTEK